MYYGEVSVIWKTSSLFHYLQKMLQLTLPCHKNPTEQGSSPSIMMDTTWSGKKRTIKNQLAPVH